MLRPLYVAHSSSRRTEVSKTSQWGSIPQRANFFTLGELLEWLIRAVLKTASVGNHAQEFESPTPLPVCPNYSKIGKQFVKW